jgi:hypothetical protein
MAPGRASGAKRVGRTENVKTANKRVIWHEKG